MANSVDIIFQGIDKVSGVVNKITSANEGNAKSLLAMVGGWAAVGAAAYKAADYIADSVTSTVDYGKAVRDMARITGDSVEETSRLIQVSDDLVISQEELSAAMRGAVQKGVDTSIDGLARLSDEYLKLDEGLERSEFLVENFGRTGLKMGAMMEKGGDGIRAMADSIDDSLIMTDDAIEAARDYEIAMDNLGDSFQGLSYTIGNTAIPALSKFIEFVNEAFKKDNFMDSSNAAAEFLETIFPKLKTAAQLSAEQWKDYGEKVKESLKDMADDSTDSITALDEAIQKQRDGLTEASLDWANKFRDQGTAMQELVTEQNNLITEKQKLIDEGWWPESEAVQGVTTKIDENITKIGELKAAQEEERQQMLLNIVTQGMDEESKYAIYNAMGMIDDNTYSLIQSVLEQKQAFSDEKIDADELAETIKKITEEMNNLDGKTASIHIMANYDGFFDNYDPENLLGMAKGGSFTVPPGFQNDTFPMMVSSGERVSVTPANEARSMDVGNYDSGGSAAKTSVNVYLQYSPVVSLADRYEAETKLVPYIESALRKIR